MRLSVRTKLINGFTLVLIVTGIVGWRGITGMRAINEELNKIKSEQFVPLRTIANANIALIEWKRAALNHVIAENIKKMDEYERIMIEQKNIMIERLQQLSEIERLSKEGKELVRKLQRTFQTAEPIRDRVVMLSRKGQQEEARLLIRTQLRSIIDGMDKDMTGFLQLQERQLDAIMNATDDRYEASFRRISWIIGITLFITLFIALFLSNTILKAVNEMVRGAKSAMAGDLKQAKIIIKSKDEFEYLGTAFNQMLDNIASNITELERVQAELRVRNAELAESNSALDDFSYIVSHDLREPLRGIRNLSSFLVEDYTDKLGQEGRSKLERLKQLSRRLENQIESILYYSRVGRVALSFSEIDLNTVLEEAIDSIKFSIEKDGTEIRMPKKLPAIWCDRVRVGEVFGNLIANAIKFNDKPEKWIEIGFKPDQDSYVFHVRDNGIGIRRKHFEKIFKMFQRLHGRNKYRGGTGAGLTIVKKIIERQGGKIWVESTFGEGTTFYFTLQGG